MKHIHGFYQEETVDDTITIQKIWHSITTTTDHQNFFAEVDMKKAYHRLRWDFIRWTLTRASYSKTWMDWIMACVTQVTYTITLNGTTSTPIMPKNGIRQGNPWQSIAPTPHTFILCANFF